MVAVSGMYICLWTHLAGVAGFGLAVDSKEDRSSPEENLWDAVDPPDTDR